MFIHAYPPATQVRTPHPRRPRILAPRRVQGLYPSTTPLGLLGASLVPLAGRQVEDVGRQLDGVEASILHLSLVGFALPLCLSQSYDLVPRCANLRGDPF